MVKREKKYSFENLSDPRSWRDTGSYIQRGIPSIHFKTDGTGFRTLHEAFESVRHGEGIIEGYRQAKKAEQTGIHVEEVGKLRKDLDSISKRTDSLIEILQRPPSPNILTVPVCAVNQEIAITKATASYIEAVAIDSTVNRNNWKVREEDLHLIAQQLPGKPIMLNHSRSVRDLIGKISRSWVQGNQVRFAADYDDEEISEKVKRGHLTDVSIQLLGRFVCEACGLPSRNEKGKRIHVCEGSHELVLNPEVVEVSFVPLGAFKNTKIIYAG